MITTTPTQDGISVAISTRAVKLVQLELVHSYLYGIIRVRMTPANARAIAGDLVAAAQAVEASEIIDMPDAGAGGHDVASPQRCTCVGDGCAAVCTYGLAPGYYCRFGNSSRNSGYVNWSLLTMLAALAGVWGAVGVSVAHWAGWFK